MSQAKFQINPRTILTNIKIPWNITDQQLEYAIAGSILFALSCCLYYFVFGKLIGRTSLVELLKIIKSAQQVSVYITVLAGVIFCSAFVRQLHHQHFIDFFPFDSKEFVKETKVAVLALAGFMVGVGNGLAGACTFGHGVSGVARGQTGSILAFGIFFTVAHLVSRWKLAQSIPQSWSTFLNIPMPTNVDPQWYINSSLAVPFIFFIVFKDKTVKGMIKYMLNFLIGVLFAMGMMVGGITNRQAVIQSLNFNKKYWNPSIIIFYSITIAITSIILNYMIRNKVTPVFADGIENPKQIINFRLIFGSVCFGVGWGLGGMCPASMYTLVPLPDLRTVVYWFGFCVLGFRVADFVKKIEGAVGRMLGEKAKN